jgi:hypothetical protein
VTKVYSTCPTCDDLLLIADPDLPVHPSCEIPYRLQLEIQLREAARCGDLAKFDELAPIVDAPRKTSLPRSAALYAEWGWPVFPLRAGQKVPATRHGFEDATTDTDQVAAWWRQNPAYNIGLATGRYFDVIDIDTPKKPGHPTGYVALANMDDAGALPPVHGVVITGRGGKHLYVLPVDGATNRAGIAPGIDMRAKGGYVVAPPSVVDSKPYTWHSYPSPALKQATAKQYDWLGAA